MLAIVLAAGCSETTAPPPRPPLTYAASTPEELIQSFVQAYENRNAVEYAKLFTGDFTFEFSNAADPSLVQKYSTGWFKADEMIAGTNLFQGGVNEDGVFQPAAVSIALSLGNMVPGPDTTRGDSAYAYRMLHTTIDLSIEVPGDLVYHVGQGVPQFNRFFLVRGDFADSLDTDQPADTSHWYIRNWRDQSADLGKPSRALMNDQSAWGRIKGLYR